MQVVMLQHKGQKQCIERCAFSTVFLNTRLKNLNSWAWELRPHAAGNDAHADRVHCVVSFIEDGAVVLTFYTCSTKALSTQWIWTQDPLDPSAAQSQQPISV